MERCKQRREHDGSDVHILCIPFSLFFFTRNPFVFLHILAELIGNRMFWKGDAMIHRRSGVVVSVKCFSNRTGNSECVNSENLQGVHLADGKRERNRRRWTYEKKRLMFSSQKTEPKGQSKLFNTTNGKMFQRRRRKSSVMVINLDKYSIDWINEKKKRPCKVQFRKNFVPTTFSPFLFPLSPGATYVYHNGTEYYNIEPLWDW